MPIRKSNTYLSLVNSYLIDSPQPSSINYWWNVGSLLGLCLVIQIASGIFFFFHYSSNIELAFNSVEHIMRDVNAGWLIRYIHANGASFFFICMYLHIGKALYYGSYKSPRVMLWVIGVIIFVVTMATAFMGYKTSNSPKSFKISHPRKSVFIIKRNLSTSSKLYKSKTINIDNLIKPDQDWSTLSEIFEELGVTPEISWDNLHDPYVREAIRSELKSKSGIYIIINKISRNYYIGSAQTNNLYRRFHNHLLTNNNKGSKIVQRAVNKDGLNNFVFAIIEYYPFIVTNDNKQELLALETSYIGLLLPIYNIETEASRWSGLKSDQVTLSNKLNLIKLSLLEERKELLKSIKDKHMEEYNAQRSKKLSEIAKNRTSDYWTPKGIANISKGSRKVIFLKSSLTDHNNLCQFEKVTSAANYLCCSQKTIQRALHAGYIYVPNTFLTYLSPIYLDKSNCILDNIDTTTLGKKYEYTKPKKGFKLKLKATLMKKSNFTKIYISSTLARLI